MKLPQLSLRELFLLVVIAAIGCGWWVERRELKRQVDSSRADGVRFASKEIAGFLKAREGHDESGAIQAVREQIEKAAERYRK